jgi:RNase adaptor protein for sRNA GlmZ degradation
MCGCRPYIVGTDAGVYSSGKLYAVASTDVAGVYEATLQALGVLELAVTEKAKDVFSAKVMAKGADGKVVTIVITPRKDKHTDINIKVGPFGNKHRSLVIYEQIQKQLPGGGK